MPILTVIVQDQKTGAGIKNTEVHLFSGGGAVDHPGNADLSGITDENGAVQFEVSEYWRVGIVAYGYTAYQTAYAPPENWERVWSCWGETGMPGDIEYLFEVVESPDSPSRVTPPLWMLIPGSLPVLIPLIVIVCSEVSKLWR